MKVKVNKELCIGCGTCAILAPASFKMDSDGKAEAINPPCDSEQTVKDARDNCPVQCITVEE